MCLLLNYNNDLWTISIVIFMPAFFYAYSSIFIEYYFFQILSVNITRKLLTICKIN